MSITLDKKLNAYRVGGDVHFRVTSPLAPFYSPEFLTKEEQEFYMNRGTAAHEAIRLWLQGKLPTITTLHPEIKGMVKAFIDWWRNSGATLVACEMLVSSKEFRVAGRVDIVADMGRYRWIIDVKTGTGSKPKKATAMQTAIYAKAYKETTGYEEHVKRLGLLCRPDGKAKPEPYDDPYDLVAYRTLLSAYAVTRRYAG